MILNLEDLNSFKKNECKFESNQTFIIWNTKVDICVDEIKSLQESAKKIGNTIKRHKIFEGLNKIFNNLEERKNINEEEIINSIFLVNEDLLDEYRLKNDEIEIMREYDIRKFQNYSEILFRIDYIFDLFKNFNFIICLQLNKQDGTLYKLNESKSKILKEYKINSENELINQIKNIQKEFQRDLIINDKIIIYGQSQLFSKKLMEQNISNVIIQNMNMMRSELIKRYEDEKMKIRMTILEERLRDINDEKKVDLYVFGRLKMEIKEHVENYMLKELFIEERKLKILKECIDESCLNFTIYPIVSLEKGDIADEFIQKYNGLMGIKYY